MKKTLFSTLTFLLSGFLGFAQSEACSFGTVSEETANGGNISTGGQYEYSIASDFDVPFGIEFSAEQITFNSIKGDADLSYVNVYILEETQGTPGSALHTFENLIPTAQELAYVTTIPEMDAYEITIDLPESFVLPEGKYFLQLQAAPGDDLAPNWELVNQETTSLGRFDFTKFDSDPWFGGFAYYDHVFEISGMCTTVAEEPVYGDICSQANPSNNYENGAGLAGISTADDFVVEENTTFFLKTFKISTLQLGNIVYATIKIRHSENGMPGEEIYAVENKGPKTENYFGYYPFPGSPLDVVAVDLEFEFDEVIELEAGNYFIEIQATPTLYSDILMWEATSIPGIGDSPYLSFDDGETWEEVVDFDLVFEVSGYCEQTVGIDDKEAHASYYPNPVRDVLHIQTESAIKSATVYNATGQVVYQSSNGDSMIDTSSLSPGVYVVKTAFEDNKTGTFKVIKL